MKTSSSISRQLILTMGKVSLITTLLSFITAYFIYSLALEFNFISPEQLDDDYFNIVDFTWIFFVSASGFITSVILGIQLAKKFLNPISSLALSAKQISEGNLSVRAEINSKSQLSELSRLVLDFNDMAEKLENSVKNTTMWNAAIAHELRTPVTILQGRLHGILDGVFEADEQLFRDLLRQVEQLSLLIEDLRTLSLAENRQLNLNFSFSSLHSVIIQSIDNFQSRFDQAGLKIQANLTDERCYCDTQRLEQVLSILFDNATRYANAGILKITTKKINQDWILQLEDEGPGIAEQHIAHLFHPFYRVEQSRSKAQGGSGLGLAVVDAIVNSHQGYITYVKSSSLGGSCFQIRLRVTEAAN